MANWYYSNEGKDYGPVSTARIVDAVLRSELELDSYIISDKDKIWVKIKDVAEIMELLHKPADKPIFDEAAASNFASSLDASYIQEEDNRPVFYNLPAKTMLIYLVMSFGFFELYWFIRQIEYMYRKKGNKRSAIAMPIITWIFLPYFVFRAIELDRQLNSVVRARWNALLYSLIWYSSFAVFIIRPFGLQGYMTWLLSGLVNFVSTLFVLLSVQKYINAANRKLGKAEDSPGMWEYGSIVFGLGIGGFGLLMDIRDFVMYLRLR